MADFTDKPGYTFNPGPPPEVSSFFKNKSLKPSFSFHDVEPEEHAVQFTVAKAMQVDVLESVKGALQDAIDQGIPFTQFQKDLEPRLRKLGWWGVSEQIDPLTGDLRKVRLGSPRRLKTIYRTNMRSARAAGQWDRIQRTKRALPYLVYLLGPSEHHRPEHEIKNGLVLPVDDPFWEQWYPPNGWGCKCRVRQITRSEAEEIGVAESQVIEMREVINPRTGEAKWVPVGIDPGWESNPGLHRQRSMQNFLKDKLDNADPAIAQAAARDMATSWRARRIHEGTASGSVPIAMLPKDLAKVISSKTRVVQFSDYTAEKTRRKHGEATPEEFVRVADLLDTGKVAREISAKGTESLIVQSREANPWRLVLKRTQAGDEVFLSTFHRSTERAWQRILRTKTVSIVRE